MILKHWESNFHMSKELTRTIPIRVIFPGLPIQFWTQENLGRIANYLGKSICSDRLTTEGERVSYARMLVEMDVSQELPDIMLIEKEDGHYREQSLEYEWKPAFCEECCQVGHHDEKCGKEIKKKTSDAYVEKTEKQKQRQVSRPKIPPNES
ncbi:uncharacterized protein LOC142163087 [Nicotiana tabacum]|uniref:Uncharacterized protein LOC142163087 n=1 Tax=Nicotiana tabacum TaxID=4097 RepID=A0AC58RUN7_TOBAC